MIALLGGIEWSGKIGIGTVVSLCLFVAAITAFCVKLKNGDAPELREAVADEITRREGAEKDRDQLRIELAATKARTDITGLEDRMARRMDAFELHAKQQTEVLTGLVAAVTSLIEKKGTP